MYRIMSHVQVEGDTRFHGFFDLLLRLQGQGVRQEGGGSVVGLQVGYGPGSFSLDPSVTMLAMIAAGFSDGRATDVHIKPDIQRILAFAVVTTEMGLSDMDRTVTSLLEQSRIDRVRMGQTHPVPLERSVGSTVVALGMDPVGRAMSCRILSGHQGGTRRRTDALAIEGAEADPLLGQSFHIWGMVPVVQRVTERIA